MTIVDLNKGNKNTSDQVKSKAMLGVTIATPGYFDLAKEAAARFRKCSGCDTVILESSESGFDSKFKLLDLFKGQQICFFDADLFPIRKLDLNPFKGKLGVFGVNDPTCISDHSFVKHDSIAIGIYPYTYLNTGFLILNFADETVVKAFEIARANMINKNDLGLQDKTEQSVLNLGFKETTVNILPFKYNFFKKAVDWGCFPYIPRDIINVHAAGVNGLKDKMKALHEQCIVFGEPIKDLREEAVNLGNYDVRNVNNIISPKRKGFIVTTLDQMDIAIEARDRALKYADIDCKIIEATCKEQAHELKLSTFLSYHNEEVYLVDNDLYFLKETLLPKPQPGEICATNSIGIEIEKRCKNFNLIYDKYFCSCLVGAFVDDGFKDLIRYALEMRSQTKRTYKDELFFNISAQKSNFNLNVIDIFHNFCAIPTLESVDDIVAVHAAQRENKSTWLGEALTFYDFFSTKNLV